MVSNTRLRLIETGIRRFYRDGFRNVAIVREVVPVLQVFLEIRGHYTGPTFDIDRQGVGVAVWRLLHVMPL